MEDRVMDWLLHLPHHRYRCGDVGVPSSPIGLETQQTGGETMPSNLSSPLNQATNLTTDQTAERRVWKRRLSSSSINDLPLYEDDPTTAMDSTHTMRSRGRGRGLARGQDQGSGTSAPASRRSESPRGLRSATDLFNSDSLDEPTNLISSSSSRSRSVRAPRNLSISYPMITVNDDQNLDMSTVNRIPLGSELMNLVHKAQKSMEEDLRKMFESQNLISPASISTPLSTTSSSSHPLASLQNVILNVQKFTKICARETRPEDEWSDRVVLPLLLSAHEMLEDGHTIEILNVKSVNIQPQTLLPIRGNSRSVSTCRVDYTLAINLPDEARTQHYLFQMDSGEDEPSLCQSEHQMLRSRALFGHLEIKTRLNPSNRGVQIGVWSAAGFAKLRSLYLKARGPHCDSQDIYTKLPVIPMWVVDNETWYLYIASQRSENAVNIVMLPFQWSTRSIHDIILLLQTLHAVMEWGIKHYLPWFLEFIAYTTGDDR